MSYLEVWESLPEWLDLPPSERSRILEQLHQVIRPYLPRRDNTDGPFIEPFDGECVVLWEVRPEEAFQLDGQYSRLAFFSYFHRVMHGSANGRTALEWIEDYRRRR